MCDRYDVFTAAQDLLLTVGENRTIRERFSPFDIDLAYASAKVKTPLVLIIAKKLVQRVLREFAILSSGSVSLRLAKHATISKLSVARAITSSSISGLPFVTSRPNVYIWIFSVILRPLSYLSVGFNLAQRTLQSCTYKIALLCL